jgi:hypothetical protein
MATSGVNKNNIFTGGPDQATTGAILRAPLGTTLPTTIATALDAAFVDSGYVDSAGVKLTPTMSTKDIQDWSMATIRKVMESFNSILAWNHLETNVASLKNYAGDGNVTVTAATSSAGTRAIAVLNANEQPHSIWAFKIKDGPRKVLIIVADGQVSKQVDLSFTKAAPILWGVEVSTFQDSAGNHVYIYTDDGVFSA